MKNIFKKHYVEYKPLYKSILTSLGIIAIYDWVIAPGLSTKNTFINVVSFLGGSMLILILGLLIWENFFKTNKNENLCKTGKTTLNEEQEKDKNNENENLNN